MGISALVHAAGANFVLLGAKDTMIKSSKPVIAVGAVRTGCGKSQTSRKIIELLIDKGLKVVAVRHPMPYGDLVAQRVLAVEDGPTLTHGEMKIGAGTVAAGKFGAAELVDPRPYVAGTLSETFEKYPDIGILLPAIGYGRQQLKDLETTINNTDCDSVIIATPIDLNRVIDIRKPNTRVYYDLQEIGAPNLEEILADFGKKYKLF